jgi:hypothetical protein
MMRLKLALPQVVQLFMQAHDLQLGLQVHLVVMPRRLAVLRRLAGFATS